MHKSLFYEFLFTRIKKLVKTEYQQNVKHVHAWDAL